MEEESETKLESDNNEAKATHRESPIINDTPNNDPLSVKVDLSKRSKVGGKRDAVTRLANSARQRALHPVRRVFMIAGVVLFLGLLAFSVYAYNFAKNNIVQGDDQASFFGQIHRIINEDVEPLQGEDEDRINVLLLGQGGLDHPGGTLVDTVMVASIQPSTGKVALLSLPRDMVIPYNPKPACGVACLEYRKLNYIMELGGVDFAKETIKEVTGLPIHYYVLIDFAGFRQVIDTLGGVDVYVENGFTDYEYPDYNYGYQTVIFPEGDNKFDGERALQFARSRHGNHGEGSDFARAARQQKILEAVRDKMLSASTLLNPVKINGLMTDLGDHLSTDMEFWEMARFADIAKSVDRGAIVNDVIDHSEDGELYSEISPETGAYVLITRAGLGNYSDIQVVATSAFGLSATTEAAGAENSVVTIQNGSTLTGIANKTSKELRVDGIAVDGIGNALTKTVEKTVIYDLTSGTKPETQKILEELLNVTVERSSLPGGNGDAKIRLGSQVDTSEVNADTLPANTDFIILLGADYYELVGTSDTATTAQTQ
ncbi:MAG: hypothetical protein COW24_06215 [Candidatus Kerfeldbacteria bacterium CG15_BIG_FIL_POST_REV_8_21_14_020_45_12]|uniref:Cell envelope-related transcriptional attenuator domain-containing protein n=1 Tax=Candidatus Kerfeldbacteria bacterium CG15_BIG_FIL_POST_REV_8_21_14_020_45_12 TaxID=2014247 RepID=A0A2M7H218_9BACT|nr:MAG: hypothetical protein COW24_06215 [Candidatus Kerfeldbacteria bacterium CG15_BIG_FIL_POST_REV_8_21_14_020_45_12]PJA93434.1 MAG: hypothetical protein CO132_02985 [Candidatus Kerfeldbacteria bacterium CG_4_9_14_3_um_filter_45_8]